MRLEKKYYDDLYDLVRSVETRAETRDLLQDLLTPQELDSLAERWQEVQALASGKPQRQIAEELGLSISKITRGSRVLRYGAGGFFRALRKLKKKVAPEWET